MSNQIENISRTDHNLKQALNFVLEDVSALPTTTTLGRLIRHNGVPYIAITATDLQRWLRSNQNETISGLWNFTNTGRPFSVTSTTKVPNLNASRINGYGANLTPVASSVPVRQANKQIQVPMTPIADTDAASKFHVESIARGILLKPPVKAATTTALEADYTNSNLRLTSDTNQSIQGLIDGVTGLVVGDLILVKDQGTANDNDELGTLSPENGVYKIVHLGNASNAKWILERVNWLDEANEIIYGIQVAVEKGTQAHSEWRIISPDVTTVGTSGIQWSETSVGVLTLPGRALERVGNTFNVLVKASGGILIEENGGLYIDASNIPPHSHSSSNITSIPASKVTAGIFANNSDYTFRKNVVVAGESLTSGIFFGPLSRSNVRPSINRTSSFDGLDIRGYTAAITQPLVRFINKNNKNIRLEFGKNNNNNNLGNIDFTDGSVDYSSPIKPGSANGSSGLAVPPTESILLNSNKLSVQTTSTVVHKIARKYEEPEFTISSGSTVISKNIDHNLGTRYVNVSIYKDNSLVHCGVETSTDNRVILKSDVALPAGTYRVVVMG